MHAVGTAVLHALAHDGAAAEEGAGAENGGLHAEHRACAQHHFRHAPILCPNIHHLTLSDVEMGLPLQGVFHHFLILAAVGLGAERPHGRAFAAVEHTVLDAGFIGGFCHLAAERVQLADEVAFARAAHGGVAGHVAHGVEVDGKAHRLHPQPCRRQRRLNAGVTCANDSNIKFSGKKLSHWKLLFFYSFPYYIIVCPQKARGGWAECQKSCAVPWQKCIILAVAFWREAAYTIP